jgi:hypothetical protein
MKCKKVKENLYDFLTNRLDERASKKVQEHVNICLHCQSAQEDLKKTIFLLDQCEVPDVPTGFEERVRKRIKESVVEPLPLTSRLRIMKIFYPYYKIPIEAVAALLVVFFGFAVYRAVVSKPVSDYERIYNLYRLPKGERLIEFNKAEKPILVEVKDLEASVEYLKEIVEARNGELIPPRISLEKGYLLTITVEKGDEESFLEDLSGIGKIYMEKYGYKDKRGNICVIVLKHSG